jgi:hypothetical protein
MISHRGEEGFSSCSAHPCHHAVVTTPPEELGASVCFAGFCCLHSKAQKLDLRILISRLLHVRCCYSLMTRDHPFDGLVGRLQGLGLPPPCYPSYGAPTLTPVGLTPTECASLRWTHRLVQRSLALQPAHSQLPPSCGSLHRRLQPFRCLHSCSGCFRLEHLAGWDLHPLGKRRLSTAHAKTGRSRQQRRPRESSHSRAFTLSLQFSAGRRACYFATCAPSM